MKEIKTVCARDCYDACTMVVTTDEKGEIFSVRGDKSHPLTSGFLCAKGSREADHVLKNRVKTPYVKGPDGHKPASWDEALDKIANNLKQTLHAKGPHGILFLNYAGNVGLLAKTFPHRLWHALGAVMTDRAVCAKAGHTGLSFHYGTSRGLDPLTIPDNKTIILWGFNPRTSAVHVWRKIKDAQKNGAILIVIDPLKTPSAEEADLHISPRPGTDAVLAYGIMNHIIGKNIFNNKFVTEKTIGFEELKNAVEPFTHEKTYEITGVTEPQLDMLTTCYAEKGPVALLLGVGLQKRENGGDLIRAASLIPALMGYDRGFFYSNGSGIFVKESLLEGTYLQKGKTSVVSQVGLAHHVLTGRFSSIFISGTNPAVTLPGAGHLRKGFSRPDVFLSVHETHWTETALLADVILPAPTFFEKDDVILPWAHHYVRYNRAVIPPLTDSLTEIEVMRKLSERLDIKESAIFEEPDAVLEKAFENAMVNGTFEDLKKGKLVELKRKPAGVFETPSGKIEFSSSLAEKNGLPRLPSVSLPKVDKDGFVWITSAHPKFLHSQFQNVFNPIPSIVEMNPADAKHMNVSDNDRVELRTEMGYTFANVMISENTPPGVIHSPRLWVGLDGVPQNALMGNIPQAVGGGSRFNSQIVHITKK